MKGENGFEAKDVLRLNEAARAHLPCISEVAKSAPEGEPPIQQSDTDFE